MVAQAVILTHDALGLDNQLSGYSGNGRKMSEKLDIRRTAELTALRATLYALRAWHKSVPE